MKLTCSHCRKPMGLGILSTTYWERGWFRVARFCSMSCRNDFWAKKEDEDKRRKAVGVLYRGPPSTDR